MPGKRGRDDFEDDFESWGTPEKRFRFGHGMSGQNEESLFSFNRPEYPAEGGSPLPHFVPQLITSSRSQASSVASYDIEREQHEQSLPGVTDPGAIEWTATINVREPSVGLPSDDMELDMELDDRPSAPVDAMLLASPPPVDPSTMTTMDPTLVSPPFKRPPMLRAHTGPLPAARTRIPTPITGSFPTPFPLLHPLHPTYEAIIHPPAHAAYTFPPHLTPDGPRIASPIAEHPPDTPTSRLAATHLARLSVRAGPPTDAMDDADLAPAPFVRAASLPPLATAPSSLTGDGHPYTPDAHRAPSPFSHRRTPATAQAWPALLDEPVEPPPVTDAGSHGLLARRGRARAGALTERRRIAMEDREECERWRERLPGHFSHFLPVGG